MAYDDLKEFEGETYTGVAVGGEHTWLYPNGLWRETKVAPDRWDFTFSSLKERERSAPPGSGVPVGTQYQCSSTAAWRRSSAFTSRATRRSSRFDSQPR